MQEGPRGSALVAAQVDKDLLAGKVAVLVALKDEVDERVEATHDLWASAPLPSAEGKVRSGVSPGEEGTEERTELDAGEDPALKRVREALADDLGLLLLALEGGEVVEAALARVLALELAREEERETGGVGSARCQPVRRAEVSEGQSRRGAGDQSGTHS